MTSLCNELDAVPNTKGLFVARPWHLMAVALAIALALLACAAPVSAQTRKAFDLERDYGLTAFQSQVLISTLGTIDALKSKYPRAYARCSGKGWTDAKFASLTAFDAAWMDAVYQGQGGGQPVTGWLASQNHVTVPAGRYWQTIDAEFSGGEYVGQGTAYVADNAMSINTELVLWHERWNGDPADRNCLKAGTVGVGGNISYVEGTVIRGFRLNGRSSAATSQAFRSCGIRMSKPGEVTYTTDIYAVDFRTYGIDVSGATPHHIGTVSVFDNVVAGVGCEGCWGSTVQIDCISGDDNGAMISSTHSGANTGGGRWSVGLVKLETCVASDGRAWRGQVVGVFEGQFAVNVATVNGSCGGCDVDAAFVLDSRQPNGNPQSSGLNVGQWIGYNFANLVHDIGNRKRWPVPGDFQSTNLTWSARLSGVLGALIPITSSVACERRLDFIRGAGTPSHTTCAAYRPIIDGPPRSAQVIYLGDAPPPPTTTPCTFTYSAWSQPCTGTQTRTFTASPAGCTGTPPADSLSRSCTVPPPPPPPSTGGINPADVTVVLNSADPGSAALAAAYCSAWGIPTANVVSVNLGNAHELASATTLNAARTAINTAGRQYTALAFAAPSRYAGGQSITSAITFGSRTVSGLTVSALYNYTGLKPRTDKGVAPSWLVLSTNYIRRDAHGTKPSGQALLHLAKDTPSSGNLRGSARAGQTATGVTVWDMRSTAIGGGVNACNWINQACFLSTYRPGTTPIVAAYQSMYYLGTDGGAVWAKGFYGDHVTSYGGYLPVTTTDGSNSQGQTALTYHLNRGASLSVGSVSEPCPSLPCPSLPTQFVNVSVFHPLFASGKPVGVAAWAAVQCPDRMLFAGDGLCAPFLK